VAGCGPKKTTTTHVAGEAGAENGEAGGDDGSASGGSASSGGGSAGSSSAGTHGGPISDLDDFYEQEGVGFCQRVLRCFEGNDDFMSARFVLQTQARCEQLVERINATSTSSRDLRNEIAAGHLHVVPEKAQQCLADLAACNGPNGFAYGSCRDVFEGNAQLGDACQRSEDCAGSAFCQVDASCPGKCVARKLEGEACQNQDDCAYTSGVVTCYQTATGGVCHTLTQGAPVGAGKPCTRRLSDAAELVTCQDGLWCDTAPGGDPSEDIMGVCGPPLAEGQACRDSDDVCLTGFCNTDTLRCMPVKIETAVGAACNKEEYVICDPLRGLVCGQDLKCHGSGDGTEGSGCYTSDFQIGCVPGLYCDRANVTSSDEAGVCRKLLADGEPCSDDRACAGGACTADKVCGGRLCFY
jgi:hypothetical protein